MSKGEFIYHVCIVCVVAAILFFCGWCISFDGKRTDARNAQFRSTCGSLVWVSTFTDVDKTFIVCAPAYVSSPSDFVIKEAPTGRE
jgi:hypothetical protein